MKTEETMSPEELGEKLEETCNYCGQAITKKEQYEKDGLCPSCYENEMLGLNYG